LPPPLEKNCKLHAEKVKFGAYFASYKVAYKVNEPSSIDGVWHLWEGGGDRPLHSPPMDLPLVVLNC